MYGEAAHLPAGLLRALLPGPVTVVLKRRPDAPLAAQLNPGVGTLGVLAAVEHYFTTVASFLSWSAFLMYALDLGQLSVRTEMISSPAPA